MLFKFLSPSRCPLHRPVHARVLKRILKKKKKMLREVRNDNYVAAGISLVKLLI